MYNFNFDWNENKMMYVTIDVTKMADIELALLRKPPESRVEITGA